MESERYEALMSLWRIIGYRALLDIALRLGKGDTAHQICQQLTQRKYMYTCYYMSGDNHPPPRPSTK